jgi:hypothetical protein
LVLAVSGYCDGYEIEYKENLTGQPIMNTSVDKLTTQAMALSGEARALLAERLVESLDQESVSKIWLDEAKKRRDEVRRGEVQPIPGLAVMEEVRKLIDEK